MRPAYAENGCQHPHQADLDLVLLARNAAAHIGYGEADPSIAAVAVKEGFSAPDSGWIPRGEVTVEIVPDSPGHAKLPINGHEIIDRALTIQTLAGRNVTFLTYDTGHSHRARIVGHHVKKLKELPLGEEPDRGLTIALTN